MLRKHNILRKIIINNKLINNDFFCINTVIVLYLNVSCCLKNILELLKHFII